MSVPQPSQSAENPERHARRQAFWQIYLPAFLGAAVFIALCVWAALFTIGYVPVPNLADQQSPAAEVAVIWILLPTCLGSLIPMALLGGMVYLLGHGIRGLPRQAHRAQDAVWRLSAFVQRMADKVAEPVIKVDSAKAGLDSLLDRIAFWKHSA
jgi:hypothetical protein